MAKIYNPLNNIIKKTSTVVEKPKLINAFAGSYNSAPIPVQIDSEKRICLPIKK
jgi:hypothetical protein